MTMYLEHFGLREPPFRITPHTEFFFSGANRGATLEALIYAILAGEGLVKVTGEVGTGKTMLCRVLMERLPKAVMTIYLAVPSLSRDEMLVAIAGELGIDSKGWSTTELLRELQQNLVALHIEERQVVALIDEAHAMPIATLEELRLLSNMETGKEKLLQIVLFGQPELDEHLRKPKMRQIRERITHAFDLAPLPPREIEEYINFRLRAAGYRGPDLFNQETLGIIAQASEGLTRRINIYADKTLLAAFAAGTHTVSAEHARAAVADTQIVAAPKAPSRRLTVAGFAGLLAGIAIGLGAAIALRSSPSAPPAVAAVATAASAGQQAASPPATPAAPSPAAPVAPPPAAPVVPAQAAQAESSTVSPAAPSAASRTIAKGDAPPAADANASPAAVPPKMPQMAADKTSGAAANVSAKAEVPKAAQSTAAKTSAAANVATAVVVPKTAQTVVDKTAGAAIATAPVVSKAAQSTAEKTGAADDVSAAVVVPKAARTTADKSGVAAANVATVTVTPKEPKSAAVTKREPVRAPASKVDGTVPPASGHSDRLARIDGSGGEYFVVHLTTIDATRPEYLQQYLQEASRTVEPGQLFFYPSGSAESPKVGVVYGIFQSRQEAKEAMGALPAKMREQRPHVRSVEELRLEARRGPAG